jgi:hypothetical protein
MAVLAAILLPGQDPDIKVAGLAATTSTAEQLLGKNKLFAINATQDICIKFGVTGMSAAAATNFRIPANQTAVFDTGEAFTHIRVFNLGSSAADIYAKGLSRN